MTALFHPTFRIDVESISYHRVISCNSLNSIVCLFHIGMTHTHRLNTSDKIRENSVTSNSRQLLQHGLSQAASFGTDFNALPVNASRGWGRGKRVSSAI